MDPQRFDALLADIRLERMRRAWTIVRARMDAQDYQRAQDGTFGSGEGIRGPAKDQPAAAAGGTRAPGADKERDGLRAAIQKFRADPSDKNRAAVKQASDKFAKVLGKETAATAAAPTAAPKEKAAKAPKAPKEKAAKAEPAKQEAQPEKPAEQPSTRLGEAGARVFGRQLTDTQINQLGGGDAKLPKGYSVSVDVHETVGDYGDRVKLQGIVTGPGDKRAGSYSRTFLKTDSGELHVMHSAFFLNGEEQDKGLGKAIFNAQVDAYEAHGVDRVNLDAASVGKYVWTKAGFDWDDKKQLTAVKRDLKKRLTADVGKEAAAKIVKAVKTPRDLARVTVGDTRHGKDTLIDHDDIISMGQRPSKIVRL